MSVPEPVPPRKSVAPHVMEYGLVVAVLVWAGAVGLMAYHLNDSPWRWAFAALSIGGVVTVGAIAWIRKYVHHLEAKEKGTHS